MTSKVYALTKRPKLIDLNGDNVNFKLEFIVQAVNPDHQFHAIVLTQEQLDSVDLNKIEMKVAKGKISGNITANNNKYQNYFLVLKKIDDEIVKNDLDVEIVINLEKITENLLFNENSGVKENAVKENFTGNSTPATTTTPEQKTASPSCVPFYKKPWFWLFVMILIAVIGLVYYNYFYLKKPFFWHIRQIWLRVENRLLMVLKSFSFYPNRPFT
jgi:hypothetical protein